MSMSLRPLHYRCRCLSVFNTSLISSFDIGTFIVVVTFSGKTSDRLPYINVYVSVRRARGQLRASLCIGTQIEHNSAAQSATAVG